MADNLVYKSTIRSLRLPNRHCTIGMNHHHNRSLTNGEKVWDRYSGCLVITGTGSYTDWNGIVHAITPGSFVHHFPGRYHHIERHHEGWEEYSLRTDADTCEAWIQLGLINPHQPVLSTYSARTHAALFDQLHLILEHPDPQQWHQSLTIAQSLLCKLWTHGKNQHKKNQTLSLEQAYQTLATDYQATIELKQLAAQCDMSYSHFRRRFKERYHLAPNCWRNNCLYT